ncbi:hypothetical protein C7S20_03225 [Christiangramia fulva]|uniref:Hybrid sensor histidine kinase/response regulator n=2 Tax=Christiangramia fulva TaxID=2126553 RepID=A0A2R3Z249_9FLAO|nr:hypothetical protein C7S20_03225 [Christiangramia fulva]
MFMWGIAGTVTGQDVRSVQRIKSVEPFERAEKVSIQQDLDQNLWITTPLKVIRYNSAEMQIYNRFKGVPKELGQELLTTYTDSFDHIWLAGEKGLAVYNLQQDAFDFVSNSTGKIYKMFEDDRKQLWIAAENGIFKLDISSKEKDFSLSRFISENTMASSIVSYGNLIAVAGPNGVITINLESGKFDKKDLGYYQNLEITTVLALDDKLVIGTKDHGLYTSDFQFSKINRVYTLPYAASQAEITSLQKFGDQVIVATNGAGIVRLGKDMDLISGPSPAYPENIYTTYLDMQNLLWMVSNKGLFLQNFTTFGVKRLVHNPSKYSSLADDFVTALVKDSNGNIWVGSGEGLSIWNSANESWRHIKNLNFEKTFKAPDNVTNLASVNEHVWVATSNDGVYKVNINTLLRAHYSIDALYKTPIKSAQSLFVDSKENVWIGGDDGFLTEILANSQIKTFPIKNVMAMAELGPKDLIVATKSRIHSLNPYSGRITDLTKLNAGGELTYYDINDLEITNKGIGLIATDGEGLLLYDFDSETYEKLNKDKGLPSNNVVAVKWTNNDEYWISTDKGLAFYDDATKNLKVFTELNGLTSTELTTGFSELEDGSYVLGSVKGLNVFKPRSMLAQSEFKPDLKLQNLEVASKDNKKKEFSLAGKNDIELSNRDNFRISFKGISNLNPQDLQYSWKLQGFDDEWSEPSSVKTVNYASLPAGSYDFMVKSRLGDAAWSDPKTLKIDVQEAGATISSVYLFMGIGIIAMILIFAVVFIKRSRSAERAARAELRNKLKKEFGKPIENAVQSLNKISETASEEQTEDLQRYAARFDELFQQILNFNYEESVYEISRIDMHQHIPALLGEIEPLFENKSLEISLNDQWGENVFYYNREYLDKILFSLVSSSACYFHKSGKVIVNLIETSVGDLKLQITDNGLGIPPSHLRILEKKTAPPKSRKFRNDNGLNFILQARELIQQSGGSFNFESEKNEGSTFTAILKNRKQDYRKVPERAAKVLMAQKQKTNPKTVFPAELTNFSESKILIIENDKETKELLMRNIGKYCQIYQASTAEEGIEKAGMIFPDIIISATVLPDMNAFQLTKMLKRNIGLNHISIFMVADEDVTFAQEQLEGLSEVIRKPIDINLMLTRITEILKWQRNIRNSYVRSHIEDIPGEYRSESDERFIANLADNIIQNIKNETYTVHDLSASVGISSNTLFMKLKSLVDLSPQDFMEFTRLNYARELMEKGEFNIMEIAYKSGFSSPKLFYSSFKKFFGYTPAGTVEKPD